MKDRHHDKRQERRKSEACDAAISSGLPPARPMVRFSVSARSCACAIRIAAHDLVGFFLDGKDLCGPRRFLSERRQCQSGKE